MDKKVTGIISYITIIGWIIAFACGDREGAKFHLNQSLVLNLANLILTFLANILGGIAILSVVFWVLDLLFFVLWILGLVHAITGEEKPLPIIGNFKILN
ncbi:MAG: hypothetical protein K6B75_08110 [Lachnospiraceae bacterium]|nr:hypothetical protein [Lachnospiraceae bacterium]